MGLSKRHLERLQAHNVQEAGVVAAVSDILATTSAGGLVWP